MTKIAQLSPVDESVPAKAYGGTERVVHYLTQELAGQGHQVALFVSGDSRTSAELRAYAQLLDRRLMSPLSVA